MWPTRCAVCICGRTGRLWTQLEEAEKLYLTLADTTQDDEFRYEVLESLAALYAVGYKDTFRVEQVLRRLPTMKYCRESVASSMSNMMKSDPAPRRISSRS